MFGSWANGGAGIQGQLRRAAAGAGQAHHIAFRADDEEQLRGWLDQLRTLGTNTSDVMDRTYFRSIYFRAPDGMLMEIATDVPGFGVDEDEHELGRRLVLPQWLEADRERIESGLSALPEAA